ncbi:MAG: hypothetical protein Q9M13_06425, partial [Mariprofundales bacterium]|nr:hypothetical protein [Mariprofundales bacterium]
QQQAVPSTVTKALPDLVMLGVTSGYAVARSGEVLKYAAGVWSVLSTVMSPYADPNRVTSIPVHLTSIAVNDVNPNSMMVLSDEGLYGSLNGGVSWSGEMTVGKFSVQNTVSSTPFGGRTLSMSGGTVVAGDWSGGILSSQDGGVSWSYLPAVGAGFIRPQMVNAQVGYAIDAESAGVNRLFKTVDGGLHWAPVTVAGGMQIATNLEFIDIYTGWVVGENELVTKVDFHPAVNRTVDQHNLGGGVFEAISMLPNRLEGWAVGQKGLIRHTTDGGTTWTAQTLPIDLSNGGVLLDVYAVDVSHVWAVGRTDIYSQTPLILFYNGAAWQQQAVPASVKGMVPDIQ